MEKITVLSLQKKKKEKKPIVALTCFDAFTAQLIDDVVDISLVGDSVANTRLGYPHTLPVTVDEMLHHVKAAGRGIHRSLLVADMPFQSYEAAPWEAAVAAGRFIKEGGAHAVKVEGGSRVAESGKAILKANVPVMGHVGLVPQSIHLQGGYHIQGKPRDEIQAIIKDAKLLESLGVFAIVLEGIPASLGKKLTKLLKIPTIGIGAGPHCDGQILVLDDMLGLTEGHAPRFVKKYAHLREVMKKAIHSYQKEVLSRRFPTLEHSY